MRNLDKNPRSRNSLAKLILACLFASALWPVHAQTQAMAAQVSRDESYKTFYLTNLTQTRDLNDVQTGLRNFLPKARIYGMPSQEAIAVQGTSTELQEAQQIISDLDRTKKLYRLTYTLTDTEQGKRIGAQHYSVVVASGTKTDLKQGSKVPLSTRSGGGTNDKDSEANYLDVGLAIEVSLDGYLDGVRLSSKLVQSSLAEEKAGAAVSTGDPVIRQTTLEGTATLVPGKPLILGSLDLPGSTRHQEVEVVAEVVR